VDVETLERERRQLMGVAYRMLGTVADAEDAVQETYVRWYRLSDADRDAIHNPGAWLTRVAGRVCLDMLGSARARRERYVGEWLPEPLPGTAEFAASVSADPLEKVTLDDSVSTALLVVLESLSPPQRVSFVLHDVFGMPFTEIAETVGRSADACRQLASQARRHIRERRAGAASREMHDALAQAFAIANADGDLAGLVEVLDPDVVLHSDGGGLVSAARRPVVGADRVARFLLGVPRLAPDAQIAPAFTPDGLSFFVTVDGAAHSVITLGVRGDRIADIWIMRNPEKLTLWG
jgi:RNA polymerase sigma-70 factor (ECF subfamily)